jgi:hypothetical protein
MRTFMLTWNPRQLRPENLRYAIRQIENAQPRRDSWSAGRRSDLPVGSRVFLLRQGKEPRGIVAAGYTLSNPEPNRNGSAHILCLDELKNLPPLRDVPWGVQSSGREFSTDEAAQVETVWQALLQRLGRTELPSPLARPVNEEMTALSIQQPWAWAILHAGKDIENRTWNPQYRGELAIHASATVQSDIVLPGARSLSAAELQRSAIIGVVDLIDVVRRSSSRWFEGPYGLVLANPRPLRKPIACKGALMLWSVSPQVAAAARRQLG